MPRLLCVELEDDEMARIERDFLDGCCPGVGCRNKDKKCCDMMFKKNYCDFYERI